MPAEVLVRGLFEKRCNHTKKQHCKYIKKYATSGPNFERRSKMAVTRRSGHLQQNLAGWMNPYVDAHGPASGTRTLNNPRARKVDT